MKPRREFTCPNCLRPLSAHIAAGATYWAHCSLCGVFVRVRVGLDDTLTVTHVPPVELGDDEQPTPA
jgi:transcription elongation factor Elf1